MIKLNLVSPSVKKEIESRRIHFILRQMGGLFVVVSAFMAIYILLGQILISYHFIKTVEQSVQMTKSDEGYGGKTRDLRTQVNHIADIQSDFVAFSHIIEEIMKTVDNNITFSTLNFDRDEESVLFNGNAKTRESLLKFKENLEISKYFDNVELPLANILQKENIKFNIKVKLNINANNQP